MLKIVQLLMGPIFLWLLIISCANKKDGKNEIHSDESVLSLKKDTVTIDTLTKSIAKKEIINHKSINYRFKYDLALPDQTAILSLDLMEISALSFDDKLNVLYAVNDERGMLFTLNPESGKILERNRFAKKGDYEGVEIGESGKIYVVLSNGDIRVFRKQDGESIKHKTDLHSSNDVEGLGYHRQKKMLLLACKGYPSISKSAAKSKSVKAVYGWSIETQKLIEEPILKIQDKNLVDYFESLDQELSKSRKKKYRKRLRNFSPSGIAYNESEDLYYLISSVGKTLVIVDDASNIQHVEFLDDTYFAQPEGICFGKDNALYISNEGRGLVAKMMRFDVKK